MGVMVLKPPGVYVALKIVAALADRAVLPTCRCRGKVIMSYLGKVEMSY
jgi:hypothetical protein